MPQLFLHVGYPKTGTTGLQRFFSGNRAQLRDQGLLYPDTGRLFHADGNRYSDAHYAITFALGLGSADKGLVIPAADEQKTALLAEFAQSGCHSMLISSEYFITAKKLDAIAAFFADFDITVLVYLRRHDHAYESGYNQTLKSAPPSPWSATIEAYILYQLGMPDVPYDYLGTLDRWGATFGQQNIKVRPFETRQNTPDIYADCLAVIGLEHAALERPPRELNSSVSHRVLCAIRLIRGSDLPADRKTRIISALLGSRHAQGGAARYLSPPMRSAVLAFNREPYANIARKYLNRPDGLLFQEDWPGSDPTWSQPVDPPPDEILGMIAETLPQKA